MTPYEAYLKSCEAQKRMPEHEPLIMQYAELSYWYARDVIKGRWSEAEPVISESISSAYFYARDVIKGRWSEAEPMILKNARYAYHYACVVIQERWYEAEEIIAKSVWKDDYLKQFFNEPVVAKDEVDIVLWQRKKAQGYFTPASLFDNKVSLSLLDMMVEK